jgi:hypothetical protein
MELISDSFLRNPDHPKLDPKVLWWDWRGKLKRRDRKCFVIAAEEGEGEKSETVQLIMA